jgi:repressor LexA
MLKPSNPKYTPITVDVDSVEVQGLLVGVWRNYNSGKK